MNLQFTLHNPASEIVAASLALMLFIAGYVLGRYHGADKVLRDQHNARVPKYPRQPSDAS
jgi:hypothetical protein